MSFSKDTCREQPIEAACEVGVILASMEFLFVIARMIGQKLTGVQTRR